MEWIKVTLVWEGEGHSQVAVAGDFTNWDLVFLEKVRDNKWVTEVKVEPGCYAHKWLVDGQWINKEGAEIEIDNKGNANSLLVVEEDYEEETYDKEVKEPKQGQEMNEELNDIEGAHDKIFEENYIYSEQKNPTDDKVEEEETTVPTNVEENNIDSELKLNDDNVQVNENHDLLVVNNRIAEETNIDSKHDNSSEKVQEAIQEIVEAHNEIDMNYGRIVEENSNMYDKVQVEETTTVTKDATNDVEKDIMAKIEEELDTLSLEIPKTKTKKVSNRRKTIDVIRHEEDENIAKDFVLKKSIVRKTKLHPDDVESPRRVTRAALGKLGTNK